MTNHPEHWLTKYVKPRVFSSLSKHAIIVVLAMFAIVSPYGEAILSAVSSASATLARIDQRQKNQQEEIAAAFERLNKHEQQIAVLQYSVLTLQQRK